MTLEELMNVEVTSVSKRPQPASEAAAAIAVVTREDIRRAGITNIPDALRLVPGVEVARINANTWAVTIRGFNSRFANKLLVMINGRSIYTPLFSGVFWDRHDLLLEDVDRIEVIRGPGAAVWGANAVNGVVNIITRHTNDTQGNYASMTAGNVERGIAEFRHGAESGPTSYRVYGKGRLRDDGRTQFGESGNDQWQQALTGFRADTDFDTDQVMLEGQLQYNRTGERADLASLRAPFAVTQDVNIRSSSAYILGRWSRNLDGGESVSLQSYLDYGTFSDSRITEDRTTFDLEFQHNIAHAGRHEVTWGIGYRMTTDRIDDSFAVTFDPDRRTSHLFNGFVQDTISLIGDELNLVLGTKLEYNDFTGFEVQPNARILWRPVSSHTFWGAVSRAIRTPSRAEDDVRLNSAVIPPFSASNPTPFPAVIAFQGDRSAQSEELIAYEVGYRASPADWFSYDLALFYNDYSKLRAVRQAGTFLETNPAPPHLVIPLVIDNSMTARTYGFEAVANWQMLPWWRWRGTYSLLLIDAEVPAGLDAAQGQFAQESSPQQQASLRAMIDVSQNVTFDATMRFVDRLPAFNLPGYTALDLRIGWRPTDQVEVAVSGRNLLAPSHSEFGSEGLFPTRGTDAERSVFATISVRF